MALLTNIQDEKVVQLPLFEDVKQNRSAENQSSGFSKTSGSSFHDPAFASNKVLPVHRWVPWIAGFASGFVRDALNRYLSGKGIVLDPFSGVGTTLVEAILLGHDALGFEINPYAALACRTKLNACQIDLCSFHEEISRFRAFYAERVKSDYTPKSTKPKGFRTRSEFYGPLVLRKVLIFHDFASTIQGSDVRDLFRLAFANSPINEL